jgi:hypothetical protein
MPPRPTHSTRTNYASATTSSVAGETPFDEPLLRHLLAQEPPDNRDQVAGSAVARPERGLSRSSQDHEFFPARGRGRAELLVSQTVREVVAGSGFVFEDAGMHDLKGLPGQRTLVRATNGPDHGELVVR